MNHCLLSSKNLEINQVLLKNPVDLVSYMNTYFKLVPADCSLFSEDGFEIPIHKEVLYQTNFMREIVKSLECCCCKIDILFPTVPKEHLQLIVQFLYTGQISNLSGDKKIVSQVLKSLTELGFPKCLNNKNGTPVLPVLMQGNTESKPCLTHKPELVPVVHVEDKMPFKCICNQSFALKSDFQYHIVSAHETRKRSIVGSKSGTDWTQNRPYKCSNCSAELTSKSALEHHVSSVHGEKKPFECPTCKQKFPTKQSCEKHIFSGHESFSDQKCIKKTNQVQNIKEKSNFDLKGSLDLAVHEDKISFECSICDHSFGLKSHLEHHISSVHESKRARVDSESDPDWTPYRHEKKMPFKCSICNHSFDQKSNLEQHVS